MSEALLDADGVRRFANPTGGDDVVVVALRKKQYLRTICGLAAIRDRLANDLPELSSRTGFSDALAYISSVSPALQRQVLGYPSVAFWTEVALDLLRRQAHIRFPELHIETHLESFGRVGLAAAFLGGGAFACNTRMDNSGGVFLPGTCCYYSLLNAQPFERVRVEFRGGQLRARQFGGHDEYEAKRKAVPRIGSFEINVLDEDLRLPGRYDFQFDRPFRDADVLRWASPLQESLRWIWRADAHLGSEIDTSLQIIVPVRSQNPEVHVSATFREAPGLMALSWTPDTPVLTEALVHEYHHGKLNTLLALDTLVAGPTEEAVYYSPWRTDPRPLVGILHGAFVFHAVVNFWTKFLAAGIPLLHEARLRQRLCLVCRQTREALSTLVTQADLTPCGSILVRHLLESATRFDTDVSHDSRALQRVEGVMHGHREQWQKEYGHLAPQPRTTGNSLASPASSRSVEDARHVSIEKLAGEFPADDPVVEDLTIASEKGRLSPALDNWIQISRDSSEPLLEMLSRAHAAYVTGVFDEAAARYGVLTQCYPSSRYFWQCFAHCLRHLGRVDLGTGILTNLGKVSAEAQSHNMDTNIEESLSRQALHAATVLGLRRPV